MELESASNASGAGLYSPRVRLQITVDAPCHTRAAMCRTTTHKYVKRLYEQDELYDLAADPLEETNVVDDPAYSDILVSLKERMLRWYMEPATSSLAKQTHVDASRAQTHGSVRPH